LAEYNVIYPMLESILDDVKTLSSKKPDMLLTPLKVEMVNKLISASREILVGEPVLEYLHLELNEEKLPQHSDVVMILRQYLEALIPLKPENKIAGIDLSKISVDDLDQIEQIMAKYV